MHLIVCLDERDGMLFNNRRQSRDRMLRQWLQALVGEGRLWMNGYSARQFEETAGITVDEDFLEKADGCAYCFVENADITPFAGRVSDITVYRWNTVYPADTRFPWALFPTRQLVHSTEFAGSSHDVITEEVYCL